MSELTSLSVPRPKMLVVDDNPNNLLVLRRLLAKVDADLVEAACGNDALRATLEHEFALILLDVHLPDISGFEIADFLRGEAATRQTPIIFVTATYADDIHRRKGFNLGAADYISKPIDADVLLSKVRVFLDLQRSRDALRIAMSELAARTAELAAIRAGSHDSASSPSRAANAEAARQPRIALVTAAEARDLDDDLAPLVDALRDAGAWVDVHDWDAVDVRWAAFDAVVLRSTWDYTARLDEFLSWVAATASATTLLNAAEVVRWSADKHYLRDLELAGIPTVASRFVAPGDDAGQAVFDFLAEFPQATDIVVKPCVGAGSRDARRHARTDGAAIVTHVAGLLERQRSVLLQPYLERVDAAGETALIFFDGEFSHAIRKGPLLQRGADSTRALFAAEQISPRMPASDELAVARATLDVIAARFDRLVYARVDLLRGDDGSPCVLELELLEPSLFFVHAEGAAKRFAACLIARCAWQA